MISELIDAKEAFLQGKFVDGEEMYAKAPDEFGQFDNKENEVLKMNVPIYGTKQAAHCFFKALVAKVKYRKCEVLKADP